MGYVTCSGIIESIMSCEKGEEKNKKQKMKKKTENKIHLPANSCRYPATLAVDFWITCVTQHADTADTATITVIAVAPPIRIVLICHHTLGMSLNLQSSYRIFNRYYRAQKRLVLCYKHNFTILINKNNIA